MTTARFFSSAFLPAAILRHAPRVDGDGLLEEDVLAGLDGGGEVDRAEAGRAWRVITSSMSLLTSSL